MDFQDFTPIPSSLPRVIKEILSRVVLWAMVLCTGCSTPFAHENPFRFRKSKNIEKADPAAYHGRIAFPDRVIELYRHKEDHKAIITIAGKATDTAFDTLLAGRHLMPEIFKKQNPDAYDLSTKVLKKGKRTFLIVKFKQEYEGNTLQFWDIITHERGIQYHFMTSFPVGTPKNRVEDLLSILETLDSK